MNEDVTPLRAKLMNALRYLESNKKMYGWNEKQFCIKWLVEDCV